MIDFSDEYSYDADFMLEDTASEVISYILSKEKFPFEWEVSLTITNNETIHEMNLQYREIDRETDVLSFPAADFPSPADFSPYLEKSTNQSIYFNPENGNFILGDIVLSMDRVIEQANEYGHSIKREYAFLIAHSTLHLIGYDHMNEEDAKIMEEKQKTYLDELGIRRFDSERK